MKVDWSQPGMIVSGVAHAAMLVATLVAFSDTRKFDDVQESVAVDVISASELSQMTKGETTAKQPAKPESKPRADKVAELQEVKPPTSDPKRDVPTPAAAPEALPIPPERPRDLQAEAAAKAEAEAKAAEAKAAAEKAAEEKAAAAAAKAADAKARAEARAKADAEAKLADEKAEAEALAKAEAEAKAREAKALAEQKLREAKAKADALARAEAKAKAEAEARAEAEAQKKEADARAKAEEAKKLAALAAEPPKPVQPKPQPKTDTKFDPSQIEKLLTSKEKPQQAPSTGKEVNRTASIGAPNAAGPKLSMSQRDAIGQILKDQLHACWSPPPGIDASTNLAPKFKMQLNSDGSLVAEPVLVSSSGDVRFQALADSARRAIKRCAPYKIPAQFMPFYDDWRDWNITFDPKDLLG